MHWLILISQVLKSGVKKKQALNILNEMHSHAWVNSCGRFSFSPVKGRLRADLMLLFSDIGKILLSV